MAVARLAATRSTCPRAQVGCVLVVDNQIVATGYNGSAPGKPHCTDAGCLMDGNHCQRCVHAEMNAVAQAAKHGISVEGAVAFVTHTPCMSCCKVLAAAGIRNVTIGQTYGSHARLAEETFGLEFTYEPE